MFVKGLMLTATVLFLSACEAQAAQIAVSWDGGGDGSTWGDPRNWNPNIVPDNGWASTYAVTIDSNSIGADAVEIGLEQNRTIDRLDCYGSIDELVRLTANSVKLTLNDPKGLMNHGELVTDGICFNGNVINSPGAYLEVSHATIEGNLYNLTGGKVQCENEFDIDSGEIQNAGLVNIPMDSTDLWPGEGFQNTGTIHLFGGECGTDDVFDNGSTGVIEGYGAIGTGEGIIENKGVIRASAGSLLLQSHITHTGKLGNDVGATLHIQAFADVNNQGTIETNAAGAVVCDSNLVNEPNGIIKLLGGTLAAPTITQLAGATFEGFGGITGDIVIDPNGIIRLAGPTNIVGDVEIVEGATLEISDGLTLVTGQITCTGAIRMKGGWIIPQGSCDCDECNIDWQPGLYTNVADFNLDGKVDFKDFAYFADAWLWKVRWD